MKTELESTGTPIDHYLSRQADMSAVERFARFDVGDRTGQWADLIPLTAPGPGEQYNFVVDLDECTGCKACVTACHSLNGLDTGESFRAVGLVVSPNPELTLHQSITSACHHCAEPACLIGCPAEAYEKDSLTGIVKHLDDDCIGCQYCTLTCPYEVPLYNERLGIVRKCDMCSDRLSEGEAPACVQGCPNDAISIGVVSDKVTTPPVLEPTELVPGAAPSELTAPTTVYNRAQTFGPTTMAVDEQTPTPSADHRPLVVMLVLTQSSVGLLAVTTMLSILGSGPAAWSAAALSILLSLTGLAASILHLGQPLKAWRVLLGLKHSWLSREALLFGLFVVAQMPWLVLSLTGHPRATLAAAIALMGGVAAVGSSVMIYGVTGRPWWRVRQVIWAFVATTIGSGLSTFLAVSTGGDGRTRAIVAVWLACFTGVRLAVEAKRMRVADERDQIAQRLLAGPLAAPCRLGRTLLAVGGIAAPLAIVAVLAVGSTTGIFAASLVAAAIHVGGELVGRSLFFRASTAPSMPGAFA